MEFPERYNPIQENAFVCKLAVILCGPQYITCVQWLCLRQNRRHVSNWIVKENTKFFKRKSVWKWQPHCIGLKVLKHRGSLFEWVRFQSYFYLGAVWMQLGAIWINLKTLSVKWRSHCLGLNVLIYCGQFLVVSIWQSTLPNQFPNLGAMWIKYCFHTIVWRMAAIFPGLNVLTNCCWSKIASNLQTTS